MNHRRFHHLMHVCALPFIMTGCGFLFLRKDHPAPRTRSEIARAKPEQIEARLSWLKAEDFPALARFHTLWGVTFNVGGATDSKLEALADIGFTNLWWIEIRDSPEVTDRGMEALSRIPTLNNLTFHRTSITDRGLRSLAKLRAGRLKFEKCSNVTADGLVSVAGSQALTNLFFSAENLVEEDVIKILNAGQNLRRCGVGAPYQHVHTPAVQAAATRKNIDLRFWSPELGSRPFDQAGNP